MLSYGTTSNTLIGGFSVKPNDRITVGFDLAWNSSDAGLDPFVFSVPAEYLAANPNQSYDFSLSNTYSDLDVTRWEASLNARYQASDALFLTGSYRRADYQDDAPYLYDTSGSLELYSLGLGWVF